MNIKRLLISIIVVFVALSITDILIHGLWLSPLYGATKELWRPEAEMSSGKYMGWLHAGHLLAAITFTTLWAVGFAQNAKATCAIKYGLFMALYGQTHTLISYAVQPFTLEIVWKWIISACAQGILLALILFKVYKPRAA
ncbi:hypothetical protein [Prosthecobacter sp.]|uniref:hypothetical protein n=1 Tax=Prosthecobacter sp. TaxID=1965333 RepID=UPI00378440BC